MLMDRVKLIEPKFDSNLVDLIMALEPLKHKKLTGSTPPWMFFQLKRIFHMLESVASARIEGNNTTVLEYVESELEEQSNHNKNENILEIENIELAMGYIESFEEIIINRAFISELHQLVVKGLSYPPKGEGDDNAGNYRNKNVAIKGASHIPPDIIKISEYMEDLFSFINKSDLSKYDLLKIALAHHRFVWIHPFNNGNGRTVRLLTYAMLMKFGFNVSKGRILNPTAVFCNNRDNYYKFLAGADTGEENNIIAWCEYMLDGLRTEIEKIDKLVDYSYLQEKILIPGLKFNLERQSITIEELNIIKLILDKDDKVKLLQAKDISTLLGTNSTQTSRKINKLLNLGIIRPIKPNSRKYILNFMSKALIKGIINSLNDDGFLPL